MGIRLSNSIYLAITMIWSGIAFTILLPDVKNFVYSKCVWRLNFQVCDKFLGIEGAYRFTASSFIFFLLLALITLNCNVDFSSWVHNHCWVLKVIGFIAINVLAFLVPLTTMTMKIFYFVMLMSAIIFLVISFMKYLDLAHAWKLFWLRKAGEKADTPTCYVCTWLFVIHLMTSLLYSISLDVSLAFFFFNDIAKCRSTILFLAINLTVCFISIGMSYFHTLRDRQANSQIVFAMLLANSVYVTWLALSDPENEYCNMFGTVFTGSILESSISLKSLVSLAYAVPVITFISQHQSPVSYIKSLVVDELQEDMSLIKYAKLHVSFAVTSAFALMAITNFYEPVYFKFEPIFTTHKPLRTAVIYFEGYNRPRFIILCFVSNFLPVLYVALLLARIIKDLYKKRRREREVAELDSESDTMEVRSVLSDRTDEFLYIELTKENAIRKLKSKSDKVIFPEPYNLNYLLIQCFYIREYKLSFWLFPRYISQTNFKGRNGSNACTIIAALIGRFFARSDIPIQFTGYLGDTWINLLTSSIEEGNRLYDSLVKDLGVLDLSIDEVAERLGTQLNIARLWPSLPVSFSSDVESATVYYQIASLVARQQKQVIIFTHKRRTSAFLIYADGNIIYADSHAFGDGGSVLIASRVTRIWELVNFLKVVLGENDNKLATLTLVEYEKRRITKSH